MSSGLEAQPQHQLYALSAGKHYKLEQAAEAIEESQKSGRDGKFFLEG